MPKKAKPRGDIEKRKQIDNFQNKTFSVSKKQQENEKRKTNAKNIQNQNELVFLKIWIRNLRYKNNVFIQWHC